MVLPQPAAVGAELAQARSRSGHSLIHLSAVTGLPEADLAALEAGDLGSLGSPARAKAAVRIYGNALDIDAEALLRRLQDGGPTPEPWAALRPHPRRRLPGRWVALVLLGFLAGLAAAWLSLTVVGGERANVQPQPAPRAPTAPSDPGSEGVDAKADVGGSSLPSEATDVTASPTPQSGVFSADWPDIPTVGRLGQAGP